MHKIYNIFPQPIYKSELYEFKESELYYLWKSKSAPYARKLAKRLCRPSSPHSLYWPDITKGANHYCTLKTKPYWVKKGEKPVKVIGNHKFYKLN